MRNMDVDCCILGVARDDRKKKWITNQSTNVVILQCVLNKILSAVQKTKILQ